jgi:hypothetical protein
LFFNQSIKTAICFTNSFFTLKHYHFKFMNCYIQTWFRISFYFNCNSKLDLRIDCYTLCLLRVLVPLWLNKNSYLVSKPLRIKNYCYYTFLSLSNCLKMIKTTFRYQNLVFLSHWAKSKCTRLTLNRKYWDDLESFNSPSAGSGQASQPDRRLSK